MDHRPHRIGSTRIPDGGRRAVASDSRATVYRGRIKVRPRSNPKSAWLDRSPPRGPLAIGRGDGRHFSAYLRRAQTCMRSSDSIRRRTHSTDQLGPLLQALAGILAVLEAHVSGRGPGITTCVRRSTPGRSKSRPVGRGGRAHWATHGTAPAASAAGVAPEEERAKPFGAPRYARTVTQFSTMG